MSPIDVDTQPGQPTSILRTFVGLYLRDLGGWIRVSALLELLESAGVSSSSTRSAVSRLKGKDYLLAEKRAGHAGYRLDPRALTTLERGDRRIYSHRIQGDDEPWCLVSYSVPEVNRSTRSRLRNHLVGLGFGMVNDGIWIAPGHLREELEDVLDDLEVRSSATVFMTSTPSIAGTFAEAANRWWDIESLAARHEEFLARCEKFAEVGADASTPEGAFVTLLKCTDSWKTIPYVDPGLPASALPPDWPGTRSVDLYRTIRKLCAEPALRHVTAVAGRAP